MTGRDPGREPGVRDDSIRNVFGPRARLVKSFAGIMNPTRIVISTSFFRLLSGNEGEVGTGRTRSRTMTREISIDVYPFKTTERQRSPL